MYADNYVTQPTAWVVIGKYMNVDETFTYLKSVPNRLVGEQDPVFAKAKTRQEATELAYVFTNSIIALNPSFVYPELETVPVAWEGHELDAKD